MANTGLPSIRRDNSILGDALPGDLPTLSMADIGYQPLMLSPLGSPAAELLNAPQIPMRGIARNAPMAGANDSPVLPGDMALPQLGQVQPMQRAAGGKRPAPQVGETVNGYTYLGGDPRSQDPKVWRPASGDTFLNSLPLDDQKKTLIKAIANYQLPPGTQRGSIGSPEVQQLIALAKQYDPDFNPADYNIRQGTRTEFTKGQYSKTVTALNTAIDHARTLAEEADALHNTGSPAWNWVANNASRYLGGDPRQGMFEQTARNLGGEVVKAVTGGEGALDDRIKAAEDYSLNGSPAQQVGALANTVELLKSKLEELDSTYKRGMGQKHSVMDLLSPSARKSWSYLSSRFQQQHGPSGGGNVPPAPAGVDAKLWQHMTPQERALWQK